MLHSTTTFNEFRIRSMTPMAANKKDVPLRVSPLLDAGLF